jgi:ribose 5-phosphate isomerase B
MKVYVAADHAGFELKEKLKVFVGGLGYVVEDCGAHSLDAGDDYPDFVSVCAQKVANDTDSRGIVLGGSGEGEAMDANRVVGVRACEYYGGTTDIVRISREHNDANILSLGARFVTEDEACAAVQIFLETPFSGEERHVRRIEKLDN